MLGGLTSSSSPAARMLASAELNGALGGATFGGAASGWDVVGCTALGCTASGIAAVGLLPLTVQLSASLPQSVLLHDEGHCRVWDGLADGPNAVPHRVMLAVTMLGGPGWEASPTRAAR